jgi:hypothetical protein
MYTPWGKVQIKTKITRGINFYSTAGHGGFKVSKTWLSKMPKHLVNEDGWYEKDCEWCKVVLAFPELFGDEIKKHAQDTFDYWFNKTGKEKLNSDGNLNGE